MAPRPRLAGAVRGSAALLTPGRRPGVSQPKAPTSVVLPRRFSYFYHDRVYLRQHLLIRDRVRVRLDAEGDRPPIGALDEAGKAVDPVDAPRFRDHPSLEGGAAEPLQQGARLSRMR